MLGLSNLLLKSFLKSLYAGLHSSWDCKGTILMSPTNQLSDVITSKSKYHVTLTISIHLNTIRSSHVAFFNSFRLGPRHLGLRPHA